jgi:hypothetical protein
MIVRCWLKCDLLAEDAVVALTRAHGKADADSLLDQMSSLVVLSISANVPSAVLADIRAAIEDSDGAIEHWVNLEDDSNVQRRGNGLTGGGCRQC